MVVKESAMSEHTPDTTNGLADGAEPSMEDILASIRKIIADDEGADPALELPKDIKEEVKLANNLDTTSLDTKISRASSEKLDINQGAETLDLEIVADDPPSEAEIDSLIADMDMAGEGLDIPADSLEELDLTADDDIMELGIPMEEDLVQRDLVEDVVRADDTNLDMLGSDPTDESQEFDDDLSAMLDDMMNDVSDEGEIAEDGHDNLELVVDPAADLLSDVDDLDLGADELDLGADNLDLGADELEADLLSEPIKGDADMALVKSLMADLTGVPLHGDVELHDDLELDDLTEDDILNESDDFSSLEDGLADESDGDLLEGLMDDLVEPDVNAEDVEVDMPEVDISDTDTPDDVMDEILSLTLDDEMGLQAEELEVSGIEVPLSLKDIAAQAEADAAAIDGGSGKALTAGAVAAIGGAALTKKQSAPELDMSELDITETSEGDDIDNLLSKLDKGVDEPSDDSLMDFEDEAETELEAETEFEFELETETEIEIESTPDPIITEETPEMPRRAKKDAIIDEVTESATADVFSSLNKVVEEKAVVAERGDRIGDLVQEALRPMLKEWLDENLKGIVERAVTKEVKRISSGK